MRPHPLSAVGAFLLDGFFLALSIGLALFLRFGAEVPPDERARAVALLPLVLMTEGITLLAAGIYRRDWTRFRAEDLLEVLRAVVLGGVLLVAFAFFARLLGTSRTVLLAQVAVASVLLLVWRGVVGNVAGALRRAGYGLRKAVVVGSEAGGLARALASHEGFQARVAPLEEILRDGGVRSGEIVFVAEPDLARAADALGRLSGRPGIGVLWVPTSLEILTLGAATYEIAGRPVLDLGDPGGRYYLFAKRLFDIALGLVLAPIALGAVALAAVLVRATSPGPVFFRQTRLGRRGRPFSLWKIRTMSEGVVAPSHLRPGETLRDDPRVTPVGRYLRRTSLDEWPQIWNILRGEMSFVGPRPEVPEAVASYNGWERRILEAPPGLTGLVQVSGRDDLSEEEKRRLDLFYLRHRSLAFDLVLLARTAATLLLSPGRA